MINNAKIQKTLISVVSGLLIVVLAVTVFITAKNNREYRTILDESVKSNLISISVAAREIIDIDKFDSYNSKEDLEKDSEAFFQTLAELRSLQQKVGAEYIYALKLINGAYYFIFDTDPEVGEDINKIFEEYPLSPVHQEAFDGKESADIMNVVDEWGTYNTGAVPIWKDGKVIGIISADIEDYFIRESNKTARTNIVIIIIILTGVMLTNIILIYFMVIVPVRRLTESVSASKTAGNSIYGSARNDEFGVLAKTIENMRRQLLYSTDEKEAALKKAQSASRAKSDFLSNMSHEIRTPMNAIIGMTAIAEASDNIERKDYAIKKIKDASIHLLGVINDVLDMSKIEANKLELHSANFNIEEMLQKTISIVNFRAVEKHQNLKLNIDEKIPRLLKCDDHRLAQVLTNLLSNAVKFTPENGSIIINAKLLKEANGFCNIQFDVADTGVGISEEQKSRLFVPFEQAESSTTRKYGGTGLGLAISKRIAELMGGDISVVSELGKGSTFSFNIIAEKREKEPENNLPVKKNIDIKNLRILVVDDDKDIREYFADITKHFNIKCDFAEGGREAMELIEKSGVYDIHFIDWQMPEMDGIELTRKIKQINAKKSVCIMISSSELSEIKTETKTDEIDDFLQKPIFPTAILESINKCLGVNILSERQKAETPQEDSFDGYRALLVEDVEINREIVQALLEPTKIEVDCAENGAEAVRMFTESPEKYNIIFMDVQMPEMDGYEATKRIRAFEADLNDKNSQRQIPIIAMTASVFMEDIRNCLEAGMNDHLGKPLDFNEVLVLLRQHLSGQLPDKRRTEDRRKKNTDRRIFNRRQGERRKEP